jgi:outer membrane protein TolC
MGWPLQAFSQSPPTGWGEVLEQVASNNKELKMNQQQSSIVHSQLAAANALPDPSVSYTHQYGNKAGMGINGEWIASQSFDFPTVYVERNKLIKSRTAGLDLRQADLRRQILLQAYEICLDLVLLRQEQSLLNERLTNAVQLEQLYAKRLQTGDANLLETNKISLELLNIKTEARRKATAIAAKQQALEALNGGLPLVFEAETYEPPAKLPSFDELCDEVFALDPALRALRTEQNAAGQALRLSRMERLPGLEIGYQLNTAARGERFNGFLIGMRIPLFSNRHKVRQARAEILYSELKYEDSSAKARNELFMLYQQSISLKESMTEYEQLLGNQDKLSLLNKALEAGSLSMVDYFIEIGLLYDSLYNYMQLENDYQKSLIRMLQHRL